MFSSLAETLNGSEIAVYIATSNIISQANIGTKIFHSSGYINGNDTPIDSTNIISTDEFLEFRKATTDELDKIYPDGKGPIFTPPYKLRGSEEDPRLTEWANP